jgi:hypothetical protein
MVFGIVYKVLGNSAGFESWTLFEKEQIIVNAIGNCEYCSCKFNILIVIKNLPIKTWTLGMSAGCLLK